MTVTRTSRRSATAIAAAASALALGSIAAPAMADTSEDPNSSDNDVAPPSAFTGAYVVDASPDQVIPDANDNPAGVDGAEGTFVFFTNAEENIICWEISVTGLTTDYQSAAKTATHIHQTPAGENGPPRIAFPNPGPVSDDATTERTSSGCAEGPFTTGLTPDGGPDTGTGFTLDQIEANPAGFSADTHTTDAVSGAVRGQLEFSQQLLDDANAALAEDDDADDTDDTDDADDRELPAGGFRGGEGGSASSLPLGLMAAFTVAAGAAGAVALRRRQSA